VKSVIAKNEFTAGAAVENISPEGLKFPLVWMSGYMPTRYATEQLDPIQARAIVSGEKGDELMILSVDTCIITPFTVSLWKRMISRKIGMRPERILVIATHTHSGPDLTGLFGGVSPMYFARVTEGVVEAARKAWVSRRPARLFMGCSTHNIGKPRRTETGQYDREDSVVVMQWRIGDGVVATLVNLGCHSVVLPHFSKLLSSDLAGGINRKADSFFGGVTLFAPRIQGDVNPNILGDDPYHQNGNPEELERLSSEGFASVRAAVASATEMQYEKNSISRCEIKVSLRKAWMGLMKSPIWAGRLSFDPLSYGIPASHFKIGGVEGAAFSGEVLTCLGRKAVSGMKEPCLLISYCDGYYGYLMTSETFATGGYEPNVSPGPMDDFGSLFS